jgi:hypothetical protein
MKKMANIGTVMLGLAVMSGCLIVGGKDDDDDDDAPSIDAGITPTPDAAAACSVTATYPGGTITGDATNMITAEVQGAGEVITLGIAFNTDQDGILVELYKGAGVFAGGIVPGTYALTGAELNYKTCGLCVRFFGNSTIQNPGQDFMPTAGSVTITEVGPSGTGRLKATLNGLTFTHVTIAPSPDFTSTPVNDGCNTAFAAPVTIDVPIVAKTKPGAPDGRGKLPARPSRVDLF